MNRLSYANSLSKEEAVSIATRAHSRDVRLRHERKAFEATLIRKAAVSLTAGTYGSLVHFKVANDIGGFPWKLGIWTLATLMECLSKGGVQSFAAGVSDATMAIYVDRAISQGTLVAGEGGEI